MPICPATPTTDTPEALGFKRQPMVCWFDPGQLAATGVKALLSAIFGAYADEREVQAAGNPPRRHDYGAANELWIDYVADLGDGWNSTYTMATLLARRALPAVTREGTVATQRGRILIMGGDQVYPTANRVAYRDRLVGPYQAALPCVVDPEVPHLFAIPGNHDWYDGLTSFTRLFCQQRWIGGWQTQQSRSYFAIKLPHRWWLWGLDFQLDSDIDLPQLAYFREVAERDMQPGDRIILCTPEPSWVYAQIHGPDAYQNLSYFQERIIAQHGGVLALNLSGDLHHYCRYEREGGGTMKITAGGGGAYLFPTHTMPERLTLPEGSGTAVFCRKASFPNRVRSRLLALACLRFPVKNRWFGGFLGAVYLLYAWIVESASVRGDESFLARVAGRPPGLGAVAEVLGDVYRALEHSPASVTLGLVLVSSLVAFANPFPVRPGPWRSVQRGVVGVLHGLAHIGLCVACMWLFAYFNVTKLHLVVATPAQAGLFSVEMLVGGGLGGATLFGLYLLVSHLVLGFHANEVFSSQAIADYKNFLRLHIDRSGGLTVYPFGVTRVGRRWRLRPAAASGEPWFVPARGAVEPELIEAPLHMPGRPGR